MCLPAFVPDRAHWMTLSTILQSSHFVPLGLGRTPGRVDGGGRIRGERIFPFDFCTIFRMASFISLYRYVGASGSATRMATGLSAWVSRITWTTFAGWYAIAVA